MSVKKLSLNAAQLKWIAIITMFINHLCYSLYYKVGYDNYFLSDAHWFLTRISFVIFAYQIAEGMHYTKNRKKYIISLFIFAFISEVFYDICFNDAILEFDDQNVFFNLAFGALAIDLIDRVNKKPIYSFLITLAAGAICTFIDANYRFLGEYLIISFYYFRDNPKKQLTISAIVFAISVVMFYMHIYSSTYTLNEMINVDRFWHVIIEEEHGLLTWPILMLYNGQKGKNINKWFFYLFYPAHLIIIHLIVLLLK